MGGHPVQYIVHYIVCYTNPNPNPNQLVGTQCVLKRKKSVSGFVAAAAAAIATAGGRQATGYVEGHIYFAEAPTCGNDDGVRSPCATGGREGTAAAVCTQNDKETCYFDVSCKAGGLGCYAGGWESCRFCGFDFSGGGGTDYSGVACPGTEAEPVNVTTLSVPGSCPSVCAADPTATCFKDPACSKPYAPDHRGGLGCNAGGKGQDCRYCGFGLYEDIACPDAASTLTAVASSADALSEGTGLGLTVSGEFSTAVEVEVTGTVGEVTYGFVDTDRHCIVHSIVHSMVHYIVHSIVHSMVHYIVHRPTVLSTPTAAARTTAWRRLRRSTTAPPPQRSSAAPQPSSL